MKLVMVVLGVAALAPAAHGDVLWIELTQGDLSDDRLAPNAFTLLPGVNELFGIIDGDDGRGNIDRDYFSVAVPAGHQLTQLTLDTYISVDFAAFMGIQPGPVFPDDPDTVRPEDLMGWTLFGPGQIGQDLLPQMAVNGYGFTPPLGPGVYTFWVQQLDNFTDWSGSFVVEVPEPGGAAALILLSAIGMRRR
jgi:hypothetical protein